ncbi:hypothetical protein [Amycolatopsis solani]|uniref:hypothetical protein n=1 Tax=Amycolatopsis solani TaxID=3028615 RepID=UPI00296EEC70|nr:hypothetical protein [Amycolatopsis sp. MEP2-6]
MTTVDEYSTRGQRRLVYVVVAVVLGALLVAGYGLFRSARSAAAAVCADPAAALARAASDSALVNGAGGPGTRPVVAPGAVVRGQLAAIERYCPEQLAAYRDYADRLAFAVETGG